jgi:hypothetical protein
MTNRFILIWFILAMPKIFFGQTANETLSSHSLIIDMGQPTQTVNNGLKPYGLVYALIKNHNTPIKWIINPDKAWQGADFTHNGKTFRGGPFIIPNEYRTSAVNATIASWKAQGVVIDSLVADVTLPVFATLTAVPRWTLDAQNGSVALGYLNNAGLPATSYVYKAPSALNACDDIYVMPHADPCWATHNNLLNWNLAHKGAIWSGCHAVSALENMYNPNNPSEQTNFLSEKGGLFPSGCYANNALVPWSQHSAGTPTPAYQQNLGLAANPMMQFIGKTDLSSQNGSEQIYLPKNAWRSTTKIAVWDSDHPQVMGLSPGPAGQIIFGRGMGDNNRGWVLYQAGHKLNGATGPDNIAAQRVFFNWSFLAMLDKMLSVSASPIPANISFTTPTAMNATVIGGSGTYTYNWTAVNASGAAIGNFLPNANVANPQYVSTLVTSNTPIIISVTITDGCGRSAFYSAKTTLIPGPRNPSLVATQLLSEVNVFPTRDP